jgi:FkbM family methyltransferase
MVTSWHENFSSLMGRVEPEVIAWFAKAARTGQTWLDIGANYGYTALFLANRVGPTGRVFAFEPKLSTSGYLSQTVGLNALSQITVIPAGLDTSETLELKPFHTNGSMAVGGNSVAGPLETVLVARLDWLWPRISGENGRLDGVKIDVQGMELSVLRGMTGLLATYKPALIIELHAGVDRNALLDLIASCGYERKGVPVFRGGNESMDRDNQSYSFKACGPFSIR